MGRWRPLSAISVGPVIRQRQARGCDAVLASLSVQDGPYADTSDGENNAQPKIRCICFFELRRDDWLLDAAADTGARQISVVHNHGLNRSISDGPRYGDCDGPQRRPELRFKWGQGAGSWTAWL